MKHVLRTLDVERLENTGTFVALGGLQLGAEAIPTFDGGCCGWCTVCSVVNSVVTGSGCNGA